MFASLIFRAAKAKVPAGKVAGAAKSASKAAATPKAKRLPGLTPRQERLALEKAERDHAKALIARVPVQPPRSSYNLFQREAKVEGDFGSFTKLCAKKYASLSEAEKKSLKDRHIKLQEEYNDALRAFKSDLKDRDRKVLDARLIELPRVKPPSRPSQEPPSEYIRFITAYFKEHPVEGKGSLERQRARMKEAAKAYKAQK